MKLQRILEQCTIDVLQSLVGNKIIGLLQEWDMITENSSYKRILASTILGINSIDKLMKNKKFRSLIFDHLAKNFEDSEKLKKIKWSKGEKTEEIAKRLDIKYDLLFQKSTNTTIETIKAISGGEFYELLDYQFLIKQRVLNYLNQNTKLKRAIIQMPTGTGKTKTAMHIIIDLLNKEDNFTVVWMAHTNELLEQAYATFQKTFSHIGFSSVTCMRHYAKNQIKESDFNNKNIIFTSMQKLSSSKKNDSQLFSTIVENCKLFVVDEAHKAVAKDTKDTITKFMTLKNNMNDRSLLGLTATPGRSSSDEQENKKLVNLFDNVIFGIEPKLIEKFNKGEYIASNKEINTDIIKYLQEKKVLSKLIKEDLTYYISEDEIKRTESQMQMIDNEIPDSILKNLAEKKTRNIAILNKLLFLDNDNISTIVFATTVEQGKLLALVLNNKGIKNVCVFGDMDLATRTNNINEFKKGNVNIIINYGVLTTGFDSTNIKCVLIARPTNSIVLYSQMIGRGLRGPKMGGNPECLLVDVKDNLGRYSENLAYKQFDNYWNK
jgi:superfamily II DNA or RNA helicase